MQIKIKEKKYIKIVTDECKIVIKRTKKGYAETFKLAGNLSVNWCNYYDNKGILNNCSGYNLEKSLKHTLSDFNEATVLDFIHLLTNDL
jgi:hypothetical protein